MKRIVLISCVSKKLQQKTKAGKLYQGSLFHTSLAYAKSLKPDNIFILSALYGLIDLEEEIEPYDVTLSYISKTKRKPGLKILTKEEKNAWGIKVICQLKTKADLENDHFIILAGKSYFRPIVGGIKINNLDLPLEGKRIGERVQFMKNKISK